MKFLYKAQKGYFTIEAALLLPFVTMTIVFMIFLSFYCYDRCVLEQCAYAAALRGSSGRFADTKEAYSETQRAAESLISDKLFAVRECKTTVSVSGTIVMVTYECEVNMPVGGLLQEITGGDIWMLEVTKKVPRNKTVVILRQLG